MTLLPVPPESRLAVDDTTVRRGFSLIEMSVVIVMVGIIGAAATAVCSLVLDAVKDVRQQAALGQRAQQPIMYMMNEVLRAGGNGMPGAAAVVVENDCAARGELPACAGNDRLTVFTATRGPVCRATKTGRDRYRFEWPQGGCCFRTPDFSGHLMIQKDGHTATPQYRPVHAVDVDVCEFEVTNVLPDALMPAGANDIDDADAILIETRTFYLEPDTTQLQMLLDTEAPRAPGEPTVVGKRMLVADRIYDFQVAIGLDANNNGSVAADEYAFFAGRAPPGDLRALPPALVWLSVTAGLEKRRGDSVPAFSPLRNSTLNLPGLRLRNASVQVRPLNGELGSGLTVAGVSGTGSP